MKIKIFKNFSLYYFEDEVNEFMKNRLVRDIKFTFDDDMFILVVMYEDI